jgi:outer membrane protein assembly factor BamB
MLQRGRPSVHTLHFFPAALPLVAFVPWLLTFAGTLFGYYFAERTKKWAWSATAFAIGTLAAVVYVNLPRWSIGADETRATPADRLPHTEYFQTRGPAAIPSPVWSTKTPRASLSNPVVTGNLAIVGTWKNTVDAYSLDGGRPVWSMQKSEPVSALTLVNDRLLLAGEGVHTAKVAGLTAIELPSGKAIWQREIVGHLEAPAAFNKSRLFVSAGPGGLWCLDLAGGTVNWRIEKIHVDSTPLLTGGLVIFLAQEDESKPESVLLAVRESDGREQWRVKIEGQPWGSPALDEARGSILFTSGIGQVGPSKDTDRGWAHAVSLSEKKLKWTTELAGHPLGYNEFLRERGLIFYTSTNGEVRALNTSSGETVWKTKLSGDTVSPAVLREDGKTLVSLATDGELRMIDPMSGETTRTRKFEQGGTSDPLFLKDGLLVALPYRMFRYQGEKD